MAVSRIPSDKVPIDDRNTKRVYWDCDDSVWREINTASILDEARSK